MITVRSSGYDDSITAFQDTVDETGGGRLLAEFDRLPPDGLRSGGIGDGVGCGVVLILTVFLPLSSCCGSGFFFSYWVVLSISDAWDDSDDLPLAKGYCHDNYVEGDVVMLMVWWCDVVVM